jgi:tRNA U34 5-carboxymethylaminomethyl modifying GTPase MnmE/TrmE
LPKKRVQILGFSLCNVIKQISINRLTEADVRLCVLDITCLHEVDEQTHAIIKDAHTIVVLNKCDLSADKQNVPFQEDNGEKVVRISCLTGEGIEELLRVLDRRVRHLYVISCGKMYWTETLDHKKEWK